MNAVDTVGTLSTGYPCVRAPSQDKRQGVPACPKAPAPTSRLGVALGSLRVPVALAPGSGSSGAATCPRGSGSRLSAQGGSGTATRHLGSNTCLLSQGSSEAATCPGDGLYMLQAIKQISHRDSTIMISIGARAHISSKALRDKGCSVHRKACSRRPIKYR
jgi:hypothetical protein